jgi:hypothetical protein
MNITPSWRENGFPCLNERYKGLAAGPLADAPLGRGPVQPNCALAR